MTEAGKAQEVSRLSNDLDLLYHTAARKLGLSDSVLRILCLLREKGGCCPLHEIYRESCMSKQTISSALRQLEKAGLLVIEPTDGRMKSIRLTRAGFSRMAETAQRLYRAECRALQDWTQEEYSIWTQLTQKYIHNLREQIADMAQNNESFTGAGHEKNNPVI